MTFPRRVDPEKARMLHEMLFHDSQEWGLTFRQAVNYAWTVSARAYQAGVGSYAKATH